MATTGFSFRGSDRVLILGAVLVLLWAWNPDALKKIFPGLPRFPGTGGHEPDAAPATPDAEPSSSDPFPWVPAPWVWQPPEPSPTPAPVSPPATSAPTRPVCWSADTVCAGLKRLGVRKFYPNSGRCGVVVCKTGYQYDCAATYPDGSPRSLDRVHEDGVWAGYIGLP